VECGAEGSEWAACGLSDGSIRSYHKIIPGEGALKHELAHGSAFGSSLATLGDMDGDGIMDLAVGAPFKDLTGVLYLLHLDRGETLGYADGGKLGSVLTRHPFCAWSVGQVKDYKKISPVFGSFAAPITVGDEFGCSVANIGDLNGDGVIDLAVGACGDDDVKGGHVIHGAAGAVYILFLRRDGTVGQYRKISATSGNLIIGPRWA
jgi:hypothetical protein